MGLARWWPSRKSAGSRLAGGLRGRSRPGPLLLAVLLVLLFWIGAAAIGALLSAERSFTRSLLAPSAHQVADLLLFVLLIGCFYRYTGRVSRMRAVLELALEEALLKTERERAMVVGIVDAMGDAVSIQDPQLNILYQNRAHQEQMGCHVGERCYQAYRQESEVCRDCHLVEAFSDGAVHRVEINRQRGPNTICLEIIASALQDPEGRILAGIEVVRDMTQRKRVEQEVVQLNAALTQQALELRQANRDLEAFSHAVSHDLRTPLTRIYSSGQALQEYGDLLDANGLFFVNSITEGSRQMEALLDALMSLSRVTEVSLDNFPVDLSRIAEERGEQLTLAEPDRRVCFRIGAQLLVQGDPQLLRIALENLIDNAWKYTSRVADPVIELGSLRSAEGETVFFLKDNGAGFDSAGADQLFKPFRRLHSPQEFPGTGLGLATVRRIIQRHNGRVWGESQPGCGATFYFTVSA